MGFPGIPVFGFSYISRLTQVDTGCFRHWYTNHGLTNLGVPKFNPYYIKNGSDQ